MDHRFAGLEFLWARRFEEVCVGEGKALLGGLKGVGAVRGRVGCDGHDESRMNGLSRDKEVCCCGTEGTSYGVYTFMVLFR
jgi:hypothetical protein